jgi:protocatechuate 3,4-dioxygenase beta subunit
MAQTAVLKPPAATGSISGRVTVGATAVPGVDVLLKPGGSPNVADVMSAGPAPTATTDSEGKYKLDGVAAGSYRVMVYAPTLVSEGNNNPFTLGQAVNVKDGEAVENINFTMTRGAVLTGRVTDPEGHPVIAESVRAHKLNADGKRAREGMPEFEMWQTDDRGVYRIYGLEPGRYWLSAGAGAEEAMMRMAMGGQGEGHFQRTYYPATTEETNARIIEVKAGEEVENLDIRLIPANKNKTFAVAGRVIEAATGKPVAGVMLGYTGTKTDEPVFGLGGAATNAAGEFRLEGLKPNSYRAFVIGLEASDNYGEPLRFEVSSGDLTGLELKMHKGASISGVAVIEGANDPTLREKLSKVMLSAISLGQERNDGERGFAVEEAFGGNGQIAANGTFKLGGVRPGKVQLMANSMMGDRGLQLARTELHGTPVKELQVNAGERLSGVRLVFVYGAASIAGTIEIRGTLPPKVTLMVSAEPESAGGDMAKSIQAQPDARGQFLLEGLVAGTYRLRLMGGRYAPGETPLVLPEVEQTVTVSGTGRQTVTLVLDLSKEGK